MIINPTPKQIEAKQIATQQDKNIILYGGAIRLLPLSLIR
jgi:hypothetical protein